MSNIVGLHGEPSTKGNEPIPELVALCRELLERAESGQLRQLAFAAVDAEHGPGDGYAPTTRGEDIYVVIGGLEACKLTLLQQVVGDDG